DSEEVPFDEAERAVRSARKIYDLYGSSSNLKHWESNTSHGYQQDKRERMYGWVEQQFLERNNEVSNERPFVFEPRTELICGLPPGNKTFADIYHEWLSRPVPLPSIPQDPTSAARIQQRLRASLWDLLALPHQVHTPVLSVQKVSSNSEIIVKQLFVEVEPGIRLPAVEFSPKGEEPKAIALFLGKSSEFLSAIPEMLSRKLRIVFVDLRGIGEIDSGGRRTDNWAWFMGRPWPGLWVED